MRLPVNTMDIDKRLYLELIDRIRRGITGTSLGPMFVASPRDVSLLDKLKAFVERAEIRYEEERDELSE